MGPTVTMLGGGVGCSRLAVPLAAEVGASCLTLIVNTADDLWHYGLRICPDLDTNLYALAGVRDEVRGWGLAGDTFEHMERLSRLGQDVWFHVGDRDLATHCGRTALLRDGLPLTSATARLVEQFGLESRLLPMTDSEVGTMLVMPDRTITFQEWLVKLGAVGPVERVVYDGIDGAVAAPGVLDAIADADLVVLGPSNPISSIEPILSLPGVRRALASRRSSVVAVTPTVTSRAITDTWDAHRSRARRRLMRAGGLDDSPAAVAGLYEDLAGTFVLDARDASSARTIEAHGLRVILADTIVVDARRGTALASTVLAPAVSPRRDRRRSVSTESGVGGRQIAQQVIDHR